MTSIRTIVGTLNNENILPHSAPSWILSLAENLASSIMQDGARKWHDYAPTTHKRWLLRPDGLLKRVAFFQKERPHMLPNAFAMNPYWQIKEQQQPIIDFENGVIVKIYKS